MDQTTSRNLRKPPIFVSGRSQDSRVHALRDTEQLRAYGGSPFSRLDYVAGFTATLPFGKVHSAEIFLAGINQAKVATQRYIVAGPDDTMIAESMPKRVRHAVRTGEGVDSYDKFFAGVHRALSGPSEQHIDGVCALIAERNDNYAHWHADVLSSVVLMQELKLDNDVTFLAPELKNYRRRSLELLGIDMSRVREIPDSMLADTHISCDRLLYPSFLSLNYGNVPCWEQRVFDRVLQAVMMEYGNDKSRYPKRVYVDRSNDPKRKCLNEADLIARLRELDFLIFDPRHVSYEDEVLTFANADCIVGCMGAGLINGAFARRGAKVIELKPPKHYKTNLWKTYAALSGAHHHAILTPSDQPVGEDGSWSIPDVDATVKEISRLM